MTQRLGSTLARKLLLTTESVSFEELTQHNAFDWLVPSTQIEAEIGSAYRKVYRSGTTFYRFNARHYQVSRRRSV